MKTAEEVISILQELSPEERQKVADFLNSSYKEIVYENYSEEDIAKLDQIQDEIENGINIEEFSSMDEALKSLGLE